MKPSTKVPNIRVQLFNKRGGLNKSQIVEKNGHQWELSQKFTESHGIPAIDFQIKCLDLREDEYMWITIHFFNMVKTSSQKFDHIFDRERNTFCYRRIVTGIRSVRSEDGATVTNFPIDRCLKDNEVGENYDAAEQIKWPYSNPLLWNVQKDGTVESRPYKYCHYKFDVGLSLVHVLTFDEPPPRNAPKWPKCQKFPVQLEFFRPVWPSIEEHLEKFKTKFVSAKEFLDLYDILGIYYHHWRFSEQKTAQLNQLAMEFGFNSLLSYKENFFKAVRFGKVSDIVETEKKKKRRMKKNIEKGSFKKRGEEEIKTYERLWKVNTIPVNASDPNVYSIGLENDMEWNVSFFLSTLHNLQFISIGSVLIGNIENSIYKCTMKFSLLSETGETVTWQSARRTLTKNQNTICIPTFCLKQEADTCNRNGLRFRVKFEMRKVKEWIYDEGDDESDVEMPGENDLLLKMGGKRIAVNRNFLAHRIRYFAVVFFSEHFQKLDTEEVEIISETGAKGSAMLHFLDALYHGTKLFHISQYYPVLRLADKWICNGVLRLIAKAVKSTECKSINKKKLDERFNLKILPPIPIVKNVQEDPNKKREAESTNTETSSKKPRVENNIS